MLKYVLQRIGYMFLTLFFVISITFFLLQLIPGSPFTSEKLTPDQIALIEAQYGLDKPIIIQYFSYIKNIIFDLNFGFSFEYKQPVMEVIGTNITATFKLGVISIAFGSVIGIFLGTIAALKHNTWVDSLATVIAVLGVSVPSFVFAAVLQKYVGFSDWFIFKHIPAFYDGANGFFTEMISLSLPILSLSIFIIASTMKYMRSELIEIFNSDYILLARAKGLSHRAVVFKHAFRNAMIPVVTVIGPMFVIVLSGSTVIERFYAVPGLAQILVNSVTNRDYFVVLAIATAYTTMTVIILLIIDLLYGVIDPRVRVTGGGE